MGKKKRPQDSGKEKATIPCALHSHRQKDSVLTVTAVRAKEICHWLQLEARGFVTKERPSNHDF